MRQVIVLLIVLASVGCARLQQVLAPEPEKTAATETKPPVTPQASPVVVEPLPRFECSDGTVAPSFEDCQVNMARRRLPPAEQVESSPMKAADRTNNLPTGSVR